MTDHRAMGGSPTRHLLRTPFSWIRRLTLELRVAIAWALPAKRIVIGAARDSYQGWRMTNRDTLDVTQRSDFRRFCRRGTLKNILAEHVWEHLTETDASSATRNCYEFLGDNGRLRLAVPDGLHPDRTYIEHVRPGGRGPGARDHKVLYNYKTLSSLLRDAGFTVEVLENWDENGEFHRTHWDPCDGFVRRSAMHDPRNNGGRKLAYTSLIVDGLKKRRPAEAPSGLSQPRIPTPAN